MAAEGWDVRPLPGVDLDGQQVGAVEAERGGQLDRDRDESAPVLDQRSTTSISDRSWSLNGKLSRTLAQTHSLVAGLEAEGVNRTENALTFIDGTPSLPELAAMAPDEARRPARAPRARMPGPVAAGIRALKVGRPLFICDSHIVAASAIRFGWHTRSSSSVT